MSGSQVERVAAEAEAARREAHAQKALARTLQEQQRLLDEEALRQEAAVKDLRNELADKEVALQNAQRKLFQARTSRCASCQKLMLHVLFGKRRDGQTCPCMVDTARRLQQKSTSIFLLCASALSGSTSSTAASESLTMQ